MRGIGETRKRRKPTCSKLTDQRNGRIVFTLSGRIEAEDIEQLQQLLASEAPGKQLVLDLSDVTLVNQDAIEFLACCEANSIMLENCPAYIRQWMDKQKSVRNAGKRDERLRISGRLKVYWADGMSRFHKGIPVVKHLCRVELE